jgi:hypothetical protein
MLEDLQLSGQTESSSEAKIINSIDDAFKDNTIYITENGIKLKLKKISRLLVVDAAKKVKLPKPPTVFIEDKGRTEENPSDPTYIEELQAAEYQRGMVTIAAYLVLGTSVLEVPEGVDSPEDTEWSDTLADIEFEVPAKGRARYLAWLKYYALNDTELNSLIEAITRLSGLTPEKDVSEIKDSFRSA